MTEQQSESAPPDGDRADEADVAVVGGGPAGSAAAVFAARYGLETVVFDRGTGSLDRCAFLANYPGFPAGIDVETFLGLLREHVHEAGARVVEDTVEAVRPADDGDRRFAVETTDGRRVRASAVVAATRYDGSYLRPLGGDEMFETHEHDGRERELFDRDYPDEAGRTPVDGLYVASPSGERDVQAVAAAGQGAHAARALVEDRRAERGYPEQLARHYDWLRPDPEFEGERGDRDHWRDSFDERLPDDHGLDEERLDALREDYVDRVFETHCPPDEVRERTRRGHRRLAAALDEEAVAEAVDEEGVAEALDEAALLGALDDEVVLDAIDDETIRAYLDDS